MAERQIYNASVPPRLQYKTTGGSDNRQLIFSNNPEVLNANEEGCELADASIKAPDGRIFQCGVSILKIQEISGNFRDWWEHFNGTKRPITFAVRLTNFGSEPAYVTISGRGEASNALEKGGDEFVQLLSKRIAEKITLPPRTSKMIFKSISPYPVGRYFAGAIDFSVSGNPVTLENLAFAGTPIPETRYVGYVQRVSGNVHESLVYKGISPHSEAVANDLQFTISDSSPILLPVQYPFYQMPGSLDAASCQPNSAPFCSGELGKFESSPNTVTHWVTNIGQEPQDSNPKRKRSVMQDMIKFYMPGFPEKCGESGPISAEDCIIVSPEYKWYVEDMNAWLYPNIGNWGVHYKLRARIKNVGNKAREVHLGLRPDGHTVIAYAGNDHIWRQKILRKPSQEDWTQYFPYSSVIIPAGGESTLSGEFILSGPASGTLEQFVRIAN